MAGDNAKEQERKVLATITVTMDDQGQIGVNAPMQNKPMCVKMLAIAIQCIVDFVPPVAPGIPGDAVPGDAPKLILP